MAVCVCSSLTSSPNLRANLDDCESKIRRKCNFRFRSEGCGNLWSISNACRSGFLTGSSRVSVGRSIGLGANRRNCITRVTVNRGGLRSEEGGKRRTDIALNEVILEESIEQEVHRNGKLAGGFMEAEDMEDDVGVEGLVADADEEEEETELELVNDYWSREGGAGREQDSETRIFPQASQWVEDDLNKRIRYQNGREVRIIPLIPLIPQNSSHYTNHLCMLSYVLCKSYRLKFIAQMALLVVM